jgi:hypothetical protein
MEGAVRIGSFEKSGGGRGPRALRSTQKNIAADANTDHEHFHEQFHARRRG